MPSTRRRVLAALGVASTGLLAGCNEDGGSEDAPGRFRGTAAGQGERQTATPETPVQDRFDSVVDVVESGADPNGESPVTSLVEDRADDDTALAFPEGRYTLGHVQLEDLSNFGIVGTGENPPVLVPAAPANELEDPWLHLSGIDEFLFRDVDFDFSESGHVGSLSVSARGNFAVRNVTARGRYDVDGTGFLFDVLSADSSALVENVTARGADRDEIDTMGIYVRRDHAGELTFRNCRMENFSNNGLYASTPGTQPSRDGSSPSDGAVHVVGGVYRNNNISNVRLGSTGATARGVTIHVDKTPPRHPNGLNVRGIWLRGMHDQVIQNCRITYGPDAAGGDGAIVVDQHNGRMLLKDTAVHVEHDGMPTVRTLAPTNAARQGGPTGPVLENVTITGTTGGWEGATIVGRDRTTFRNCCIHQTGQGQSGILFRDSRECVLRGTTISVPGQPVVVERSTVTVDGVSLRTGDVADGQSGPCN